MALRIPLNSARRLMDAGVIPKNCSNVELHLPASGPMMWRFDVWVTDDQLETLGQAFSAMADDIRAAKDGAK